MAMRAVDLDLFVNSASKGFNDGAKVPSPFAAFTDAFIKGIDAQQDYETQALQNEQRQIQIEQAPIETKIKEAEAIVKGADAEVIKNNPEAYATARLAEITAKAAQDQANAIINKKKTDLITIMDGQDGVAKGKALLSGQYDSIMTAQQKKEYITNTYDSWEPTDQKVYQAAEATKRNQEWNVEAQETATKKYLENQAAYLADPTIQQLKQLLGDDVSDTDILEKGRIVVIKSPKQLPDFVKDESGNPILDAKGLKQLKRDEFGNVVYADNLRPSDQDQTEERRVFQYEGQQHDLGGIISSDTYRNFNNYKTSYQLKNNLVKNSGGTTDLDISAQKKKEREAKANAEVSLFYQKTAAEVKTARDAFMSGAEITAPFKAAAAKVFQGIADNAAKPAAAKTATPEPTTIPDYTVTYPPKETPIIPQGKETKGSKVETTAPVAGTPSPAPAFTITPGTASPLATAKVQPGTTPFATATPTAGASESAATTTPTPLTPQQEQSALKKQLAQSKAANIAKNYYEKTNTPIPPVPTSITQAREVAASSFVPSKFTVNVPARFAPNPAAVQSVAASPEMQGLSAMAKAVAVQESAGRVNAVSPTGVKGVMQVTSGTAKEISSDINRNDPVQNAIAGAIYIEKLLADPTYSNNPMLALTSYNGGPAITAEAIRLAGSTDWDRVKEFIPAAVKSPKFSSYWKSRKINPEQKATEVREYAERVVSNFGPFVYTRSDMDIANKLKQQKVLSF